MLIINRKYGFRTINFYGAQVLNSLRVMFVDVDLGYGTLIPYSGRVEYRVLNNIVCDTEETIEALPPRLFFGQATITQFDAKTESEYEIFAWGKSAVSQEDANNKALEQARSADPHTSDPLALVEARFGGLLPSAPDSNFNGSLSRRKPGLMTRRQADNALSSFIEMNPEFGFRVYATHSGLRYLCTSHLFDPASRVVQKILTMLGSHIAYRFMCEDQGNFRARLTPKPWREKGGDYAVCKFIKHVGTNIINHEIASEIEHIITYHDEQSLSLSVKKLA